MMRRKKGIKPLSAINYYLHNGNKFKLIYSAIILSVSLLYIVQMFITSSTDINYRTYVQPQKYFSSITAKSKVISNDFIDSVLSYSNHYEKVIPWVFHYTNIDTTINGAFGSKVFTVKQEDMKLMMSKMHLSLIKGRLPEPGTNEILLHQLVADNKGLGIGDKIGSNLQKSEILQGEKVIVGLLEGDSIVSFDSLEYWMKENNILHDDYSLGMIILHDKDTSSVIESFLNSLDASGLEVRTYNSVTQQYKKDLRGINIILSLVGIIVIAIVTICTSFINYIFSLSRRREFGILNAIGYSCQNIVNRLFGEIILLNLVGYVSGILLSLLVGSLINYYLFFPKGQYLLLFAPEYFLRTSCVPIFASIFGILPVWRMLKNLDPITVIEGID